MGGELGGHIVHVGRNVGEEAVVSGAEVVEAGLAEVRLTEAVARTFAVAGEEIAAMAALAGQRGRLHAAEGLLAAGRHHFLERPVCDVAQVVLGEHEVVAGIQIAVPLDGRGVPARAGKGAYARRGAHPVGQRGIEELDEDVPYVAAHPLVEDGAAERAPLLGRNAVVGQAGHRMVLLHGRKTLAVGAADRALHHGRELEVAAA